MVNDSETDVDIFRVWAAVIEGWRIVVGMAVAGIVVAGSIAVFSTPIFESKVLLAPSTSQDLPPSISSLASQFGGLTSLAGFGIGGGDQRSERAYAILGSRHFSEMFISQLDLLPVFFSDKWNAEDGKWNAEHSDDPPNMSDAVEFFDRHVRSVSRDNSTGFVSLSITWTEPAVAASWANQLVVVLNDYLRAKDIAESERSIAYLRKEYEKTVFKELKVAISRIIEQQIQSGMIASVREEYTFEILDRAVASELDDPLKPKKLLLIITGGLLGFILSLVVVLLRIVDGKGHRSSA